MTKRNANKRFNRAAILDAARRVFSRDGFANANITQIIETSGFSTGTFYNYFQTKSELMEELSAILLNNLRTAIAANSRPTQQDGIETYINNTIDAVTTLFEAQPEDIALITKNHTYFRNLLLNDPEWKSFVSNFTSFIESMIVSKHEAGITAQVILGAFVTSFAYKNNHPELDLATLTSFIKKFLNSASKGFEP